MSHAVSSVRVIRSTKNDWHTCRFVTSVVHSLDEGMEGGLDLDRREGRLEVGMQAQL
jgi:hypothetical protein